MATSMALGGTGGMNIGLGTSSPIIGGGGMPMNGNGSIGNLTPSHGGMKYCTPGGTSGTSSIHSPVSTPSSTPNSTITINSVNTGSIGKCPGSNNSVSGSIGNNNNSANIIANSNTNSNSSTSSDAFGSKCKRKINFSNLGMPGRTHQPATVAKRNARERNRVKQVNNGFAALKQHIPPGVRSKKMSKVETLRCAVDYIRNLQGMLTIHNMHSSSPAGSSTSSNNSGDIILMDDDDEDDEDQKPSITQLQQAHHHHQQLQQHQQQLQLQQQQMNGVNDQRDAFALSSSSSSSPTSSDFGAVAAHHLASLQTHQHHLGNNQLRHMSLSHQLHHHATNGVSVAAALLVESNTNTVTPNSNQLSPTSSDDPSSPSYASEASYVNSAGNTNNIKGNGMYDYENYEPVSPEDEELLDAIAWWQQS